MPRSAPNAIVPLVQQRVVGATMLMLRGAGGMTGFSPDMRSRLEAPTYDAYREFQAGIENFGTNQREARRHFEKALEHDEERAVGERQSVPFAALGLLVQARALMPET